MFENWRETYRTMWALSSKSTEVCISFTCTPETLKRMVQLQKSLNLKNRIEVMEMGIKTLSYLEKKKAEGYKIFLRKENV